MAIQKTLDLINNFGETSTIQTCYIKVGNLNFLNKVVTDSLGQTQGTGKSLTFSVEIYKAKDSTLLQTKYFVMTPTLDNTSLLEQAYTYLKSLPEFQNATDC